MDLIKSEEDGVQMSAFGETGPSVTRASYCLGTRIPAPQQNLRVSSSEAACLPNPFTVEEFHLPKLCS